MTSRRLQDYAGEFLQQDERIALDIDRTLREANVVHGVACSDADLAALRNLLFRSLYLKDVGRVADGALLCSALGGKLPAPARSHIGGKTIYKTRKIYYNVDLLVAAGHTAEVVEEGAANIVVSPDAFEDFSRPPLLFAGVILNRDTGKVVQMYTNAPSPMPLDLISTNRLMRRNGILYYPLCSKVRPDCVLTGLPAHEVWANNIGLLVGATLLGIALGTGSAGLVWFMQRRHRSMSRQLRRAIQKKMLTVVYQPIVDISSGRVVSCEALVRWRDEDRQVIRPDIFVAVAEEAGFAGEITSFMLDKVCTEMGAVLREHKDFVVTINISATDLSDPTFLGRLSEILAARKVPAQSIGLELTERVTADRESVVEAIHSLRRQGHRIYIDDFGTGYSSLSYLHELAVDVLKVDRAFTNTIGTESITASIVPQIISMAHTLGLEVVVEGVEQAPQAEYLKAAGEPIYGQGWFYGKPVSAADIPSLLAAQKQSAAHEEFQTL
jgi:sensor c-di-GMP phosphodiesterase-like protein